MKKLENQVFSVNKENAILIDWLSVTFHDIHVDDVKRLLGLSDPDIDWNDRLAFRHGYPRQCSFAGIVIRYGADDASNYTDDADKLAADKVRYDMGIMLDMSGSACRAFETYGHGDWLRLLSDICNLNTRINFTRLDLAFDDHTGILDIGRIRSDVENRYFTGAPKKAHLHWSDDQLKDLQGLTLYIGSEKSPVFIRIYDKAAERDYGSELHWVRVELVLRKERATAAVAEILKRQHIGETMCGVLRNYCCFREPSADSNKSRWPIADYWSALIGSVERIRLWIAPGEPYNFKKTREHLVSQYGQAILTLVQIDGNVHDLLMECEKVHPELKKKYKLEIDRARLDRKIARDQALQLRKQIIEQEMLDIFGHIGDMDQMSIDPENPDSW